MELTALDGGHRIGASCYVLKLAEKTIVVDCGLRFGRNRQVFPPPIEKISRRKVDLFLITHAHLDHVGAAPLFARMHPEAKIFTTALTKAIAELMLRDTVKIAERNHQIPLFSHGDVDAFLARVNVVEPGEWFQPIPEWGPKWQICFWSSGHMCGACSIMIKSPEADVMFSGDISFHNTSTVNGAKLPRDFKPYLLITEATNGDYELPDRATEIARLVAKIKEVRARNGHVLIPAFASERGPNLALHLAEAGIKVWIAGMIKDVLKICGKSHPNIQLINRERTRSDPAGLAHAREIAKPGAPPAVVVTTTGMLDFGLSNHLAFAWAEDPKNAILIPGYQAEEAFGRRLINVSHGDWLEFSEMRLARNLVRPQAKKRVLAEVERFHLSGHAGASHMAAWISALEPMTVVMVHGERKSFQGLKRRLKETGVKARILVGENGKTINNKTLCQ